MKNFFALAGVFVLFAGMPASGASIPGSSGEQLHYSINWPTGLSLGEASLGGNRSKPENAAERLSFQFSLDASIPGFVVSDHFTSNASPQFCSDEFTKKTQHGNRKADEKTTFSTNGTAKRESIGNGGGSSELNTPTCAKDALTFLYFVRKELSDGRLPQEQTVFFGAPYKVKLDFAGTQQINIGDKSVEADRLTASVRGDSSDVHFEMYFLKDAARTLAMVKVPLPMGTFSMVLEK